MLALLATAWASPTTDSLAAWAAERCGATRVEVRWLGLTEDREPAADDQLSWSGDPCQPHPHVWLTVIREGRKLSEIHLEPGLTHFVRTTVAPADVAAGEELVPVWGEALLSEVRGGPVEGPVITKVGRRAGEPVTSALVRPIPVALAGDAVTLRWARGPLVLTSAGRLREDGLLGEPVRVVVDATNKPLVGVLVTPHEVVLEDR